MTEYIVEPQTRNELRTLANLFREKLGLKDCIQFPIVEILDFMSIKFDDFNYEIVSDAEFPESIHGDTDILTHKIRIKESVYEGAIKGNGRDRMTIAHEIGHYFLLCFCGFHFQRNFSNATAPAYMSPEWQAKCFAAELLISFHLVQNMTKSEIAKKCGVSSDAASYQYDIIHGNSIKRRRRL